MKEQRRGLFGEPIKETTREIVLAFVNARQDLGCDYCGWQIKTGETFRLVVIDTEVKFHCEDDERCSRQAGK